jgi:hypothetical protein
MRAVADVKWPGRGRAGMRRGRAGMWWLFPKLMRTAIIFGLAVVAVAMLRPTERACHIGTEQSR